MTPKFFLAPAIAVLLAVTVFAFAKADGGEPGDAGGTDPFIVTGETSLITNAVDPSSSNGMNANLTYTGTVTSPQSWMPTDNMNNTIPATYQVYTGTTASGQTEVVMVPNEVTAYYSQQNPEASGVTSASAVLTNSYGAATNYGSAYSQFLASQIQQVNTSYTSEDHALLGGYAGTTMSTLLSNNGNQQLNLTQAQAIQLAQNLNGIGYAPGTTPGSTVNWVCGSGSCVATTTTVASNQQLTGLSGTFSMMLAYTAQTCGQGPAGLCAIIQQAIAAQLASLTPPEGTTPPVIPTTAPQCHAPVVKVGKISAGAAKISPMYPLVVGQDETKRGADVTFSVSVEPTSYTTWTAVPQYTTTHECNQKTGKCSNTKVFTGWKCVSNVTWYRESVTSAHASASLTQESRNWIESGDLQIHYPGAYLHNPDFNLGGGGGGGFSGNTYNWALAGNIQVADPGEFELSISGHTSGTPVHAGRGFSGGGSFMAYLRETVIIK